MWFQLRHSLSEQLVVLRIQCYVVLIYILIQALGAQHLGNLDELVVIVVAVEERFLPKDLRDV